MAPRHPSTSASCDLGLRWHRAPWRQEGRHRGKPVPEGQAAARPGAAGLGPVAGSGWRRCWDTGRWRWRGGGAACSAVGRRAGRRPARLFCCPAGLCLSDLRRRRRWVPRLPSGPAAWPGRPHLAQVCFPPERPPSEPLRGGAPRCVAWAPCAPHESWAWQTDRTCHAEETAGSE